MGKEANCTQVENYCFRQQQIKLCDQFHSFIVDILIVQYNYFSLYRLRIAHGNEMTSKKK